MPFKAIDFFNKEDPDKPIVAFYTTTLGSYMVNAKSGYLIDGIFGSRDENNFYVVQIATGKTVPYHTPIKLVFDTPTEFEELFHTKLSERTHDLWNQKMYEQHQQPQSQLQQQHRFRKQT